MQHLDLDYLRHPRHAGLAEWVLLIAGIGLCAEMAVSYTTQREELSRHERTLLALKSSSFKNVRHSPDQTPASPTEYARAHATISRIATPWDELFKAVETIQEERVSLLSLEPDPQAGTLRISGEARDLAAVLTYVARLREAKPLSNIYLLRHEIRPNDPLHPIFFAITANWVIPS